MAQAPDRKPATAPLDQPMPRQHQERQPGLESAMHPAPQQPNAEYVGSGKLAGKVALVTGGDSGIGRAVAVCYAREGADVAIVYLDEHDDAEETRRHVEQAGRRCLLIAGDIRDEGFCRSAVEQVVRELGGLQILVNNAAEQHPQESIAQIDAEQLRSTFETNVFSMFYLVKAALPHLGAGSAIINTTSVTAYRGNPQLIDYSSTKGAIVGFTRALAKSLVEKGIRVNAVAPGPVWTPLIPSTFPQDTVARFGQNSPMGRPGQPEEIAPSYVFLASRDASYMAGQVLHPNGGDVING